MPDTCKDCGKILEPSPKNNLTDITLEEVAEMQKNGAKITFISSPKEPENWEEELKKVFYDAYDNADYKRLAPFIRQLLAEQELKIRKEYEGK